MHKANINDRQSVSGVYPLAAFQEDAARNSVGDTQIVYGLRIESEPDEEGWFRLARAQHHVGELTGFAEAIFVAASQPHISASLLGSEPEDGAPSDSSANAATRQEEYEAYIDRVLEAARTADFQDPIGRGEERLEGFHGG
jgi:hypothetical protein